MKKLALYLTVILCSLSCNVAGDDVAVQLESAERLMKTAPDSSLTILESIDRNALKPRKLSARFALLYSMALDKNCIDTDDDSLITVALSYYKDRGTAKDRMLSYYYFGRVSQNGGNFTRAIIAFTNALDNAQSCGDVFYSGLIYRGLADIYGLTFNRNERLHFRQLEYDAFIESGATRYADFALKQLASSYTAIHDFEKGRECYNQAIGIARERQDTVLLVESLLDYAHMLTVMDSPEPQQALDVYSYVVDSLKCPLSLYDKAAFATACHQSGRNALAQKTLDEIRPYIGDDRTLMSIVALNEYYVAREQGFYKDALVLLDKSVKIQDSLYFSALNNSIAAAQRDYVKQQLEHEKYRAKSSRTIVILVITTLILLIFIMGYGFYRYRQKKSHEISESLTLLEDARFLLQQSEWKSSVFSQRIRQLYKAKLELIGGICGRFYEYENIGNRQKFVYSEVESVIDRLSADEESPLLEEILDEYKDGIMSKLRNDSSLKLKPTDCRLLEYWFAGFSPAVMSLLLGRNIDVIYNMRSRLRTKIRNSDSVYRDLYLSNMLSD